MNEKKKTTTKEERIEIWVDLVRDVAPHLPLPNKYKFIKLCLQIADKNGYQDEYENPFFISEKYALNKWRLIINEAASGNDGVFIRYIPENGGFKGQWRKVNKREFVKSAESEVNGLTTRIENFNYIKEIATKRWKGIQLPLFEVKQLTSG